MDLNGSKIPHFTQVLNVDTNRLRNIILYIVTPRANSKNLYKMINSKMP